MYENRIMKPIKIAKTNKQTNKKWGREEMIRKSNGVNLIKVY
jgi:hypothetical protein